MRHSFYLFTLCFIVVLTSCSDLLHEEHKPNNLPCHGFDHSHSEELADYYLVDEDILLNKEDIIKEIYEETLSHLQKDIQNIGESELENRQFATANSTSLVVDLNNVKNIKYYIDQALSSSSSNTNWKPSIENAISDYILIPNCRIYFTPVLSHAQADITFFLSTSPLKPTWWNQSNTGVACFPSNGKIGRYIGLKPINDVNKKRVVLHELGHALGMRHTCFDYTENDPSAIDNCSTSVSRYQIKGTPECDNGSVMRSFATAAAAANNLVLNSYDKLAMQYLYPETYNTPNITSITKSCSGSTCNVTIKTSSSPTPQLPYRIVVSKYLANSSTPTQTWSYYSPENNKKDFVVSSPKGNWYFKVWYLNYGKYGVGSNVVNINL